ncbi:DUF4328 domain-containing protein [Stratiformator vulcanicus]|uniref:DUF4328 domain-containing protein n=1 Tax=Stratiformator vulcanicus TaxID=2527980 RepID=A0A517R6E7_9PLAN|nr:DUF4328 domain-containing protein [Stratiformator vulcanicus]QDT39413.1 hypothetical protein Pan189_38200 [Stratiformator vulcanicus]
MPVEAAPTNSDVGCSEALADYRSGGMLLTVVEYSTSGSIIVLIFLLVCQAIELFAPGVDLLILPNDGSPWSTLTEALLICFIMPVVGTMAISSLMLFYRLAKNTEAFGEGPLFASPTMLVVYFLVPVIKYFLPYRILREIGRIANSKPGSNWRDTPVPSIVHLWWLFSLTEILSIGWMVTAGYLRESDRFSIAVFFYVQGINEVLRFALMAAASWIQLLLFRNLCTSQDRRFVASMSTAGSIDEVSSHYV